MRTTDLIRFARDAALGSPLRTSLLVLAISIGVAAVVTLTALGDGARQYVLREFSSLGTNLLIVMPGRSSTGGFNPANAITSTPRDLTLSDAQSLLRAPAISRVAPLAIGNTEIGIDGKLRETVVLGTTAEYTRIRSLEIAQGRFLASNEWGQGQAEVVIGATIRRELFGAEPALGRLVRIGGWRYRVVGVFAPSGSSLGTNTDEVVMIPVSLAQSMLNSNTLFRIFIEAKNRESIDAARTQALNVIKQRHEGEEDVTVITQDAVLHTFDRVLTALTLGVAGISAISLVVSGILVMNVMLVSVVQRTSEIGLLKALGATRRNIELAFLTEAGILSIAGGIVGYGLGLLGAALIRDMYPTFPAFPPDWAVLAALGTAMVSGILFGVAPARNAAGLDPVAALAKH